MFGFAAVVFDSLLKRLERVDRLLKYFTTGIPLTYSVPAFVMRSWAAWYSAISLAFLPPIMENIAITEMTAAKRQAAPIRQSNRNIMTSIDKNSTIVPTMSARLCASSVSVSAAAASSRPRIRPEALESKNPAEPSSHEQPLVFVCWKLYGKQPDGYTLGLQNTG